MFKSQTTNISKSNDAVQFNCSVIFYYYDNASSSWLINASIKDNSNSLAINDSVTFTYNELSAMELARASINHSEAMPNDIPFLEEVNWYADHPETELIPTIAFLESLLLVAEDVR